MPGSKGSGPPLAGVAGTLAATLRRVLVELYRIAREMLRIPAGLFMRVAEVAGALVLFAWEFVWPLLQALWRLTLRALAVAEREITPARATVVVATATALTLAASQFADYRAVAISADQYIGVEAVAPAPRVDAASAGSAHLWLGLPLAAGALGIIAASAIGDRRMARALAPVGLAVVALSLIVDAPKGLDEGDASVAYEGASAVLLGGFWAQLACGVVLVALAPLLTMALRTSDGAPSAATSRRGRRVPLRPSSLGGEAGG